MKTILIGLFLCLPALYAQEGKKKIPNSPLNKMRGKRINPKGSLGGEVNNGGNYSSVSNAHINDLAEKKLQRAKGILLAVLDSISINQLEETPYDREVKDIFLKHYHENKEHNQWIKALDKASVIPQVSKFTTDARAYPLATPQRIEVQVLVLEEHNELEIAQLLAHELGHLLKYGEEFEDQLDQLAQLIFSSVMPKSRPARNEKNSEYLQTHSLTTSKNNFGPNPADLPAYMQELDRNYHLATKTRESIWKSFLHKIRTNYKEYADENGVLRIITPIAVTGTSYNSNRIEYPRHGTLRGFEGAAYVEAIKQAFGPFSGMKVASTKHVNVQYTETNCYGNKVHDTNHSYYAIFVVPDPEAPAKYEILKWKTFEKVEDTVAHIRRRAARDIMANDLETTLLRQLFKTMSEREILSLSQEQERSFDSLEINLKRLDTQEEIDSFLNNLSDEREERIKQLTRMLSKINGKKEKKINE